MKTIRKSLMLLAVVMVALAGLTSCGDEYYDYSPVAGKWTLYSINGIPCTEYEICEFDFYNGGTGQYWQYSPNGQWYGNPITWEVDYSPGGAEYLYVYTWNNQVWTYMMTLYPDRMELIDTYTGDHLLFIDY